MDSGDKSPARPRRGEKNSFQGQVPWGRIGEKTGVGRVDKQVFVHRETAVHD